MPQDFIGKAIDIASTTGIAMMGGLGHNLYLIQKGKQVTWALFFINIALAGFVGYLAGELMPPGGFSNAVIAISGYSAIKILEILEDIGATMILKKLGIEYEEKRRKDDIPNE